MPDTPITSAASTPQTPTEPFAAGGDCNSVIGETATDGRAPGLATTGAPTTVALREALNIVSASTVDCMACDQVVVLLAEAVDNNQREGIAMETTWRVEEVTERPGLLSATLQRVEWFKKNPDYDAKLDEVGGTEGVDEFLDALPGEPGADVAEVGGTITLDVTDGPELHPLDDVILSLRVVVPVEV